MKLFLWQHSACSVVRCMYTTHTWASAVWNLLSVHHKFYVNEGVWVCRNAPPKFKI